MLQKGVYDSDMNEEDGDSHNQHCMCIAPGIHTLNIVCVQPQGFTHSTLYVYSPRDSHTQHCMCIAPGIHTDTCTWRVTLSCILVMSDLCSTMTKTAYMGVFYIINSTPSNRTTKINNLNWGFRRKNSTEMCSYFLYFGN